MCDYLIDEINALVYQYLMPAIYLLGLSQASFLRTLSLSAAYQYWKTFNLRFKTKIDKIYII